MDSTLEILITDSTIVIDKMWHNFILFTAEYKKFCYEYFDSFIDHKPNPKVPDEYTEQYGHLVTNHVFPEKFEAQLRYIEKILGENTVRKWYVEYANKYSFFM